MAETVVINDLDRLSVIDNFITSNIVEITSGFPGKDGKQGIPGPPGPRGPRGKPGPVVMPKEIIKLTGATTSSANYTLNGGDLSTYLPLQSCCYFIAMISAYNITDDTAASFKIEGSVKRTSSGNVSLVGSPAISSVSDTSMSAVNINISTDNSTGSFIFVVNGLDNKNITWTGTLFVNKA